MRMYLFRTDDGNVVEVDYATFMEGFKDGFLTLPDGTLARRAYSLERQRYGQEERRQVVDSGSGLQREIVSDAMGCASNVVADYQKDALLHGFSGVEFKPDPASPYFHQAHFKNRREWARYVKHRGLIDKNGQFSKGAALSPETLEQAKAIILREHPKTTTLDG